MKERLDANAIAQKAAMAERQACISNILEAASFNTPHPTHGQATSVFRDEAGARRRQGDSDSSGSLQMALSLLNSGETSDLMDSKQTSSLPQYDQQCNLEERISSDFETSAGIQNLIRQMQEKEERIRQLENLVATWEQKCLEESVFRQIALEAINIFNPKSVPNEGSEKEAIVRLLQHHASLSRSSSLCSLLGTQSPSLSSLQHSPTNSMAYAPYGESSPVVSGSMMAGSTPGSSTTGSIASGSGGFSRQGSQGEGVIITNWSDGPKLKVKHATTGSDSSNLQSNGPGDHPVASRRPDQRQIILQQKTASFGSSGTAGSDNSGPNSQLQQCYWQA